MAVASVTFTVAEKYAENKVLHVFGTAVVDAAADTYATGGLTLDWSAISRHSPMNVVFQNNAGYFIQWLRATGKMMVSQQKDPAAAGGADLPLSELAAAAIPAALSGASISFYAMFKKL